MASAIIIGAGAAGLGAALRLALGGVETTLVEARERIGGRVHTHHGFGPAPIELGAELIHGEGAVTHELARAAGVAVTPVDRYGGLRWSAGGPALPLAELPAATRELIAALRAAYARLPAADLDPDRSLAAVLGGQGFGPEAIATADVLLAQTCCASVETLSAADLARELRVDRAGPLEFRPVGGYGPLLDWMAGGLRIVLGAPAEQVRHGPAGVRVVAGGRTYAADTCIVTVPAPLLAAGAIRFDPPLSPAKREAAAAFRTEPATKIFFRFRRQLWDPGLAFMAHTGLFSRWWTPAFHVPGAPLLCCYVTAERARAADGLGDAELRRAALDELAGLLGEPAVRAECEAVLRSAWAADPLARGGYAHLPPGAADARPALAAPEGERLFFAGEATAHDTNPQTVHGAIESGYRAADELLAAQGRGR
jgi:monoamine oxidase